MTRGAGERLARVFYGFAAAAGAAVLALTLLSAAGVIPIAGYATFFRALVFRFGLVFLAGVFAVVVLAAAAGRGDESARPPSPSLAFAASPFLIRGLCMSTALGFLATEVGKLFHLDEMRAFFVASGYSAGFLYAVMAAETLGSVGLLVPSVRLVAATGLALVMMGAVVTHARNGDPWSDSLEALHMLAILAAIVLTGVLRERPGARLAAAS